MDDGKQRAFRFYGRRTWHKIASRRSDAINETHFVSACGEDFVSVEGSLTRFGTFINCKKCKAAVIADANDRREAPRAEGGA